MCSGPQDICLRSTDRYPPSHEALRMLNSYAPELVFLATDDAAAAEALELDIRTFHPSTAVLAVSGQPGFSIGFETSSGAIPLLRFPCDPEDFRRAIHRVLQARSVGANAPLFAFLPAKAGSGATTTALLVAHILADLAAKKVLLLECDLHAGPVSMLCNMQPSYSIIDALEGSDRLNDQNWNNLVVKAGPVDVLSSVSQQGVRRVTPWGYQRLLSFVRQRYDFVICDLPEVVNDATEVVVRQAKCVFVTTVPSTPSMYLAMRRYHDLEMRGVGAGKIKYIVNRKPPANAISVAVHASIEANQIAAIPVDGGLIDISEFRPEAVRQETYQECIHIAEFCSGITLVPPKRRGLSRFFSLASHRPVPSPAA